jgi:hypothetical protein
MSSKDLYTLLIQKAIENYMKYEIDYDNLDTMTIYPILNYFSKVRNVIAKIMFNVNTSLKEDTFCRKEDIVDFGNWRDKDGHDLLITPFYGKYNKIVNIEEHLRCIISIDDSSLEFMDESPNITLIKKMYTASPYIKVIKNNNVHGNLSILYYERDDNLIKSIENIYPVSNLVEENSLLYRCVFHTESNLHENIIKHINTLITKSLSYNKKIAIFDIKECLFEIFWFLSQASLFYRGSASISEMVVTVLYNIFNRKNKIVTDISYPVFSYGSDVHAIVNDLEIFKLMADSVIKFNVVGNEMNLKKGEFSIAELEMFAENIEYKSKQEVKDLINKIIYEKRNLKDVTIVYKPVIQSEVKESNSLISNLLEEFS